jgi:hypothetical protein
MSCCQYVSLQQLVILVDRLRNAALTDAERAEHERFLQKCVPSAEAVAFVRSPEQHPANPEPGTVPSAEDIARILIAMR